jgi:hypothetical protein
MCVGFGCEVGFVSLFKFEGGQHASINMMKLYAYNVLRYVNRAKGLRKFFTKRKPLKVVSERRLMLVMGEGGNLVARIVEESRLVK